MLKKTDIQVLVRIELVIIIELIHKPTGLSAYGVDSNNSRKAYAKALADLERQLAQRIT